MSEAKPRSEMTFEERQERTNTRRGVLEPVLARLVLKGKDAYDTLRPQAKHVGTAERGYPLLHQQVLGMAGGVIGGEVADYLMVALGDHHHLTLYQNFAPSRSFRWQFTRYLPLEELLTEQSKVEEQTQPRGALDGGGVMDISVATYRYPEKVGLNGSYTEGLCDYFNDYAQAENYIEAFEADIEESLTRYA